MDNQITSTGGASSYKAPTGYTFHFSDGSKLQTSCPPPWIRASLHRIQNGDHKPTIKSALSTPPEERTKFNTSVSRAAATSSSTFPTYPPRNTLGDHADIPLIDDAAAKKEPVLHSLILDSQPLNKNFKLITEDEIKKDQGESLNAWKENEFEKRLAMYLNKENYHLVGNINHLHQAKILCEQDINIIKNSLHEACDVIKNACQKLMAEDKQYVSQYLSGALNIEQPAVVESAYTFFQVAVNRMQNYLLSCRDENFSRILFIDRRSTARCHWTDRTTKMIFNLVGDPQWRIFINVENLRGKYADLNLGVKSVVTNKTLVDMLLREVAKITNGAKGLFYLSRGGTGEMMNAKGVRQYFFDSLALWKKHNYPEMTSILGNIKKHLYRAADENMMIDNNITFHDIYQNEMARADILLANVATFGFYLNDIGNGRAFDAKAS